MNCDQVQPLCGPALDSELDARSALEIQQHLDSCPGCARLFAQEQRLETRMRAALNHGHRTAALWEHIERSVGRAVLSPPRHSADATPRLHIPLKTRIGWQLQAGWRHLLSPWAALAAVWLAILALNFTAPEPEPSLMAGQTLPSVAEMRLAFKQRQLLLSELAAAPESAPADEPKAAPLSPRSECLNETRNA